MTKQALPYIAVASDMDGTLLRPDHTATPHSAEILQRLTEEKRVPFVLATGRHHVDVLATKRKLGLSGYVITSNGARVHDNDDRVIVKNDMPAETARRLTLLAIDDPEIVTNMYQEDKWLISREAQDLLAYYEDNKDVFFYHLFDPKTHASFEGVYKVYYTSDNLDKLKLLEGTIAAACKPGEVSVAYSLPFCLEVMNGGVNKGATLGQLLDERIYPNSDPTNTLTTAERREKLLRQTIAFGDGQNDYELLSMCGRACVMANAQAALREKMDVYVKESPENAARVETIKSNTEDGVAEKLKEVYQL